MGAKICWMFLLIIGSYLTWLWFFFQVTTKSNAVKGEEIILFWIFYYFYRKCFLLAQLLWNICLFFRIGIFCMPLISILINIILIILFYIKKNSLSSKYRPPKRSLSINEAHTFYLILTFIMFFFAAITVGYSIFG